MPGFNEKNIAAFRENDGTVPGFGRSLLLVHHVGAKTGTPRITPVRGIRESPDSWFIAASKAGADDNPAWYHNLLAHPDIVIEAAGEGEIPVHVTDLAGAERDEAWERFTTSSPGFAEYQRKTRRLIPVLRLARR